MPSTFTTAFAAAGIALVGGYIVMLKIEVSNLNDEIKKNKTELEYSKSQIASFKTSIAATNKIIESQKLNLDSKNQELKEWKTKPPKIKYKTIYKNIVKESNLTGECNDIKKLINNTTRTNLNSL